MDSAIQTIYSFALEKVNDRAKFKCGRLPTKLKLINILTKSSRHPVYCLRFFVPVNSAQWKLVKSLCLTRKSPFSQTLFLLNFFIFATSVLCVPLKPSNKYRKIHWVRGGRKFTVRLLHFPLVPLKVRVWISTKKISHYVMSSF